MVTISGTYLTEAGAPASGSLTFTPSASMLTDPIDLLNYELGEQTVTLDGNGQFQLSVPSVVQPNVSGQFSYIVAVTLNGQPRSQFSIAPTGNADIATLTPSVLTAQVSSSIATEVTRAQAAEAALQNQVTALGSGLTAASIFYPESPTFAGGAVGDGVTDDTAAVRACINAAAAANGIAMFQKKYRVTGKLTTPAGAWLHLRYLTTQIIGDFSGQQLIETAGIGTATKANDVRITGPGSIGRKTTAQTGDIFHIWGDRFVCMQTVINTYGGGRAFYGGGDRHFTFANRALVNDGQVGTGGWRYVGGSYSKMTYMHIESGDDCLQFVPGAASTDPLWNQSISHCWYECCTGISASARLMAVLLSSTTNPGGMTCSITHSGFSKCSGTGGQRGIYVYNRDSTGMIFDILFDGCSVDMTGAVAQTEDVAVKCDTSILGASTGAVRRVVFRDFSVTNPVGTLRVIYLLATTGCAFESPTLVASPSATSAVIQADSCVATRIEGGEIDAGNRATPTILAGTGSAVDSGLAVVGTRFLNVAAGQYAMNMNDVAQPVIRGVRVEPAAGSVTTKSWRTGTSTVNARVRDNDFSLLTGTHWTDLGTATQHSGNVGMSD
jgi:hypothetical protein